MNKVISILDNLFGSGTIGKVVDRTLDRIIPDKTERLKITAEIEKDLREHSYKIIDAELKDLDSARKMQIEALKQDDKFSKRYVYILSSLVLLNAVFAGLSSFFFEFPQMNREFISQYFSFSFIAGGAQVISFFFGRTTNKQNQ